MSLKKIIAIMLCVLMHFTAIVRAEPLDKIVAVVNDNIITNQELDNQLKLVQAQLNSRHVAQPKRAVLKKQVLQHMIDVELQLQLAKTHGIEVDSHQINDAIVRMANQHKLTVHQLKQSITADGNDWKKYRSDIKKELIMSRLQQEAVGQIHISDSQIKDYIKANKKKTNYQYHVKDILLALPEAPSPHVLKKAYKQADDLIAKLRNGQDFSQAAIALSSSEVALKGGDLGYRSLAALPKMFATKVTSMKKGQIKGPIRAPNGLHIIKLVNIKGDTDKQLVTLTRVKHILLKMSPGQSSEQIEKKIKNIALQIKRGAKFDDLAKKFSDDPTSAVKGGDLGWLHQGETVPVFEAAYEKLAKGKLSKPIKSDFGWHLLEVVDRKKVDDTSAYQKQKVRQALYQRKFGEAVQTWLQQLKANSYVKVTL